jgi:hypothetical protein
MAQVLAAPFHFASVVVDLIGQVLDIPAYVQFAPVPIGRVVEDDWLAGTLTRARVPQIGAIDNRELQALGAVDRQNLHGGRVGIEPAAALLCFGAFRAHLVDAPGQPGSQRSQAKLGLACLGMQELGDMPKIGELALAVNYAQQPGR